MPTKEANMSDDERALVSVDAQARGGRVEI